MKITIIGCDKIGTALLNLLDREEHDVCVVDIEPSRVKRACEKFDITGVVGNGASYDVQKKAGVGDCDLVVAATNADEVNILCCMVAKELGCVHTVIVNNNEKYFDQIEHLREKYNINLSVSPEKESAAEVARMLRFPAALQVEIFADGKMELVAVILPDDSEFVGFSIAEKHGKEYPEIQICAVERDGEVFIPSGNFVLEAGDRLSLASTVTGISKYLRKTGLYQSRVKNVFILGGNNYGYYIAKAVAPMGVKVTIMESDRERCKYLSEELTKAIIINGNDNDYELMRNEGLENTDAFVAITNNNEKNIIASLYAQNKGVNKVITAVDESNLFSVVDEIDLGSVVSQNVLTATRVLHFVKGMQSAKDSGSKLDAIFTIAGGNAFILEFAVNESFSGANIPLKDIELKKDTIIAMIIRDKQVIVPRGNDAIQVGDKVIVVTKQNDVDGINEVLL